MNTRPPVVNPHKRAAAAPLHNLNANLAMGRQSQQRVANQTKRKFNLASFNQRKKKKQQQTIDGKMAFDSVRDCKVCKAQALQRFTPSHRIPKRAHHPLCIKNSKTRGLGALSEQSKASLEDDKRHKAITQPIHPSERASWRHSNKAAGAAFFAPKQAKAKTMPINNNNKKAEEVTPLSLCNAVSNQVNDSEFQEKHKSKGAPLAMTAFASEVVAKIINAKDVEMGNYFDGLTMTVPACFECKNPHCHSIVGQKLLLVDWRRVHGLEVNCPDPSCEGMLCNQQTNFSKNQTLFPIFGLEGPPTWCMVMIMGCSCCKRTFNANESNVSSFAAGACCTRLSSRVGARISIHRQSSFQDCHRRL